MANKRTTLNFFQIITLEGSRQMHELSKKLKGLHEQDFNVLINTKKIVSIPDRLRENDGLLYGTIYSIKTANLPPSMNKWLSKPNPLNINNDDGLGEATCFLIDPVANILAIESGYGISANQLCNFLIFNKVFSRIEPAVLLDPAQIDKFYKMPLLHSVDLKMAVVQDGSFMKGEENAFKELNTVADQSNADDFSFQISVNTKNRKEDKSLKKAVIGQLVSWVNRNKNNQEIETLKIKGVDENGKASILEFVHQRLKDQIEYLVDDKIIRSFHIEERYNQIGLAYDKHRVNIRRMYKLKSQE